MSHGSPSDGKETHHETFVAMRSVARCGGSREKIGIGSGYYSTGEIRRVGRGKRSAAPLRIRLTHVRIISSRLNAAAGNEFGYRLFAEPGAKGLSATLELSNGRGVLPNYSTELTTQRRCHKPSKIL